MYGVEEEIVCSALHGSFAGSPWIQYGMRCPMQSHRKLSSSTFALGDFPLKVKIDRLRVYLFHVCSYNLSL